MKINKKLFKHCGSLAVVIPTEFIQYLDSDEVAIEIVLDRNQKPSLVITPSNELDTIEDDPIFALFIEALHRNAMENPHQLTDPSAIFDDEINEILEGIEIPDDEDQKIGTLS